MVRCQLSSSTMWSQGLKRWSFKPIPEPSDCLFLICYYLNFPPDFLLCLSSHLHSHLRDDPFPHRRRQDFRHLRFLPLCFHPLSRKSYLFILFFLGFNNLWEGRVRTNVHVEKIQHLKSISWANFRILQLRWFCDQPWWRHSMGLLWKSRNKRIECLCLTSSLNLSETKKKLCHKVNHVHTHISAISRNKVLFGGFK